ncbi:MAG: DUF5652 family protein [Prevotellaceae bacterium]|jgi:hypothetical protein|nr:DUF5652 family protein [Prevotellaceae bacterium]
METIQFYQEMSIWVLPVLISLVIWDMAWKLFGLWKSARNRHPVWFISIGLFNTAGILPIIYILMDMKVRRMFKKMSSL